MSTAPRVHFGASVWRLPQAAKTASAVPARADFSAQHWRTPSMQRQQDSRIHRLSGQTMGTSWSLNLPNPEFLELQPVHALVQSVLDEVIAQMSNWESDSAISRFNDAPAGSRHEMPAEFAQVLAAALQWAERSGGALDPTMGGLVALWGFGPRAEPLTPHSGERPTVAQIDGLLRTSGFEKLQWKPGQSHIEQPGGLMLDLCGIAKGFAVDWVVERLQQAGWNSGLFEIGGELRSWGEKPNGGVWQVQLGNHGDAQDDAPLVVAVKSASFATSGDWWHHFFADGKRYSHTLDPRTGWPIEHQLASVTVHHEACMHADALATVLTVLGMKQGMAFAEAHEVAAVFQEHGAKPCMTPAWKARFAS